MAVEIYLSPWLWQQMNIVSPAPVPSRARQSRRLMLRATPSRRGVIWMKV